MLKKGCHNPFLSLSDNYAGAFKENWCVLSVSAGGDYFVFPDVSALNAFLSFIKMASYPWNIVFRTGIIVFFIILQEGSHFLKVLFRGFCLWFFPAGNRYLQYPGWCFLFVRGCVKFEQQMCSEGKEGTHRFILSFFSSKTHRGYYLTIKSTKIFTSYWFDCYFCY